MNYQETEVAGNEYTRCVQLTIENPLGGTPVVQFREERVTVLGDRNIFTPLSIVLMQFNPEGLIPIIDPETLEETGQTVSQAQAYGILFSAYLQAAKARDAAQVEVEVDPIEP